jgi:hypothetical protein
MFGIDFESSDAQMLSLKTNLGKQGYLVNASTVST